MAKAILFGSIGVLAETSELQRQAFNTAFQEAGLDWNWDAQEYVGMLGKSGGKDRIQRYSEARGQDVDAGALHAAKSELYQRALSRGVPARQGAASVVRDALGLSIPLGFVTTTDRANVDAVLAALSQNEIHQDVFDIVTDRSMVSRGKPDPEVYDLALRRLGLRPEDAVAVEDSPQSCEAALAAGIPTIAFPGLAHTGREFPEVEAKVDVLTPELFGLGRAIGNDTLRSAVA